jgi:hypothetical protein
VEAKGQDSVKGAGGGLRATRIFWTFPQRLKPLGFAADSARLKPCPDVFFVTVFFAIGLLLST